MTRKFAFSAMFILCTGAHAEIYKWTDKDGKIHYSNTKPAAENLTRLPIQEQYTPGVPYRHRPPAQRRETASQGLYIHAPTPGASLEDCKSTKVKAVYAAKAKRRTQEQNLEEWLWKNCRAYSLELRKIEQQMM